MPVVNVKISKQTRETKSMLIKKISEDISEITHIPIDKVTVVIDEMENDNFGVGGVVFSDILNTRQ
jgi:4-oxalocrotonate tautomerase